MRLHLFRFGLTALTFSISICVAATTDPGSATVLAKASVALSSSTAVAGQIIAGSATYTAGSDTDSGHIEMKASGLFDARVEIHLSKGDQTEISHADAGVWSGPDGNKHPQPLHNSMVSAAWFSPALVVNTWLAEKTFNVSDQGTAERDGLTVEHLHCVRIFETEDFNTSALAKATAMDLFVDTATGLPAALEFNSHPADTELQDIPVRIEYGDYRTVGASGSAPYHLRKYLQNTLLLDIQADAVVFAAVPPTEFTLP